MKLAIWAYVDDYGQLTTFVQEYDHEPDANEVKQDACNEAFGHDFDDDSARAMWFLDLRYTGEVIIR